MHSIDLLKKSIAIVTARLFTTNIPFAALTDGELKERLPNFTFQIFSLADSTIKGTALFNMTDDTENLSFEASLERLETLVSSMERGDIPLATMMQRFEEGQTLLKRCDDQLKTAELRLEKLTRTSPSVQTEPIEEQGIRI